MFMDNFRFVNFDYQGHSHTYLRRFSHVHLVVKVVDGDGRVDELTHGFPVLIDLSVHVLHDYMHNNINSVRYCLHLIF